MLIDERRHLIAEAVISQGAATVAELSGSFGVSQVTIRSDLEALEAQGILRRNRGGAVANPIDRYLPAFQERSSINHKAKKAIAQAAVNLVHDGDWIIVDAGSTTLSALEHFKHRRLTIAVNSVYSANKLVDAQHIELIQIGGILYRPALCFVGKLAAAHLNELNFDRVLLGVNGVTEAGISVNNCLEVGIKQKMIECANEVIVLADSSKLEVKSLARIAPLSKVHKLVTDKSAPQEVLDRLCEAHPKLEVIIAQTRRSHAHASWRSAGPHR